MFQSTERFQSDEIIMRDIHILQEFELLDILNVKRAYHYGEQSLPRKSKRKISMAVINSFT